MAGASTPNDPCAISVCSHCYGHLLSSPDHRHVVKTGGVAWCPALLLHRPDPFISGQTGTGHLQRATAITLVQSVHGRHELGLVEVLTLTIIRVCLQVQFTLNHAIGLQVQQHDPGLGQLEAGPVDALQASQGGMDDDSGVGTGSHHRHDH